MKIKIWFCHILDRQANFGRGSRDFGGKKNIARAARKKKKYAPALKKILRRNIMIPHVFFNLVPGSKHRETLYLPSLLNYFPIFLTSLKDRTGIAPDNAQMLQEA